ncbi:type II toxin-antitoxin system VapC family toxin [Vulcanisaeta distributa]|uniref:Ribonuclease VapC n=1 Tax=Vulcanisaeta distributa (strain DSM 14429 / JCM 11212 / NBRC 100878 / IC-017) TaxID=572478 RepID=E1QRZ7_VULDI|nr:PIN domain-containing protein [Vulcanisaeta distributa]ADN50714.1 PilT protein domain protein [Vulcanisaeta distributa DSM 14429]
MLIETDVLVAHLKDKDWLKNVADRLLLRVANGDFGEVLVSREVIHEIYYVLSRAGLSKREILNRVGALTQIPNLKWIPTTVDIDLLALALMDQYGLTSIFDAYNAATCLLYDRDRKIISTDSVYDRVVGLARIDPRSLV